MGHPRRDARSDAPCGSTAPSVPYAICKQKLFNCVRYLHSRTKIQHLKPRAANKIYSTVWTHYVNIR